MISVDGIVLPNRPLSNLEITDSVKKKLRIPSFRGVFVRDAFTETSNKKRVWYFKFRRFFGEWNSQGFMVQKEQQKLLLRQLRRPTSARIATIPKECQTLHHVKNSAERRRVLWTFMLTRIKTAVARA